MRSMVSWTGTAGLRRVAFTLIAATLSWALGGPVVAAERVTLEQVGFDALPGWREDRHGEAIAPFRRTCERIERTGSRKPMGLLGGTVADWQPACRAVLALPARLSDAAARAFFEKHFRPARVTGSNRTKGLFTGYFEPEIEGSLRPGKNYPVPLYALPDDLVSFAVAMPRHPSAKGLERGRVVGGRAHAYFTREQIDKGALAGRVPALIHLKDKVDAFFLHVQGSGRVRLPDGSVRRVGFAAKSGHPYTSIGAVLGKSGALPHGGISMQSIKDWLYRNPDQADQVLWQNRSYIFFRFVDGGDPALGPPGAAGVPLTPRRSLAVDRAVHGYGTPLWLDTTAPTPRGDQEVSFRRLMIAQDTGTAIVGAVRGDVFWGAGNEAGEIAGWMKSRGRMFALLPVAVATRLPVSGVAGK